MQKLIVMAVKVNNAQFAWPNRSSHVARRHRAEETVANRIQSSHKRPRIGTNASKHVLETGVIVACGSAVNQKDSLVIPNMNGMRNVDQIAPLRQEKSMKIHGNARSLAGQVGEWTCQNRCSLPSKLECVMDGQNCQQSRCCQNPDKTCYVKNEHWSSCRPTVTCVKGEKWDEEAKAAAAAKKLAAKGKAAAAAAKIGRASCRERV